MIDYEYIYDAFKRGEMEPFYMEMFPVLLRFSAKMLGEQYAFAAEDCVQDTVLSAYINRNTFQGVRHWRSWLLTAVHNRAIQILRKANSYDKYCELRDAESDVWEGVEAAMIKQETMDAFFNAIENLPEQYRQIVELNFEQGLKYEEVSKLLGISVAAVRKRRTNLINMLRAKFGDRFSSDTILLLLNSHILWT